MSCTFRSSLIYQTILAYFWGISGTLQIKSNRLSSSVPFLLFSFLLRLRLRLRPKVLNLKIDNCPTPPTIVMARSKPVPKAETKTSALTRVVRKQGINFRRQKEDTTIPDRKQARKRKRGKEERRRPVTRRKARAKAEKQAHPLALAFSCKRSSPTFSPSWNLEVT